MGDFVFWGELRPLRGRDPPHVAPMSHPGAELRGLCRTPDDCAGHNAAASLRPEAVPGGRRRHQGGCRAAAGRAPSGSGQGAERQRAGRRAAAGRAPSGAGRAPSGSGQGADFPRRCADDSDWRAKVAMIAVFLWLTAFAAGPRA